MKNNWIITALVFSLLGQGQGLPQEVSPTAVVHLKFFHSPNADDLGQGEMEFFRSEETGLDYSPRFRDNAAANIPYGTYSLRARVPGFQSTERKVVVYQSNVWIVLGLEIGRIDAAADHQLRGAVIPMPSGKEQVWVRLTSLRSTTISDAKVGENGHFSFAGLPADAYILVLWSGTSVLGVKSTNVPTSEDLVIDPSR